ncbi:MAG: hypothetical protein OER96_08855 [Gammaproteobacteria bacterium]|nr:hypothetical protein [Gammaproteobacteria bacterium]
MDLLSSGITGGKDSDTGGICAKDKHLPWKVLHRVRRYNLNHVESRLSFDTHL